MAPEAAVADRLEQLGRAVARADLHRLHGRVSDLIGLIVEATGLEAEVGEVCEVRIGRDAANGGWRTLPAEVVGFRSGRTLLMPLGEMQGIGPGDVVTATGRRVSVATGNALLGRVLDGLGNPIDGGPSLDEVAQRPIVVHHQESHAVILVRGRPVRD